MPAQLALALCALSVLGLLIIEHRRNPDVSFALWVPTIWLLICGSRPLVAWFTPGLAQGPIARVEEGSAIDRLVLSSLILIAFFVVKKRKLDIIAAFKNNKSVLLVYLLIGASILWSDFPYVALKRWIRASGVLLMGVLILSEKDPRESLESMLLRTAYVLIPFSLVLIKYFPDLGVEYGRWAGERMWVGVSTQKNGLGQVCGLSVMILIWAALRKWMTVGYFRNRAQVLADTAVLILALHLLRGPGKSYSATSIAVLGVNLILLLYLIRNDARTRWMASHLKLFLGASAIICVLANQLLLPIVSSLLGRDESITGRTDIWRAVIDAASHNMLFGVGYGSFWGLGEDISARFNVMQAHNGYLGVYLELGLFGLLLLLGFFLAFCGKLKNEAVRSPSWCIFGICFLATVILYNISESSFFTTNYLWTSFMLLVITISAPTQCEVIPDPRTIGTASRAPHTTGSTL